MKINAYHHMTKTDPGTKAKMQFLDQAHAGDWINAISSAWTLIRGRSDINVLQYTLSKNDQTGGLHIFYNIYLIMKIFCI